MRHSCNEQVLVKVSDAYWRLVIVHNPQYRVQPIGVRLERDQVL